MPRNGAGVYSLVTNTWYPASNGVLATSSDWNVFAPDIAAALTQSVSSDGQTPMTGNLPMGNNKITGLANGTANTDAVAFGQITSPALTTTRFPGQYRLVKVGANIVLQPYKGNLISINGVLQTIPAAGVTLTPTGVAGTLYYIYAFMVGAVMTLEAVVTGHSPDATTGIEIKTGDATRTLVGMARPIAGPAWADTLTQRFVISWENRRPITLRAPLGAGAGNSGTSYSVLALQLLLEGLNWAGDSVSTRFQGTFSNNVANIVSSTSIFLDAVATDSISGSGAYAGSAFQPVFCLLDDSPSEGYHAYQVYAKQNAGGSTSTYIGSGTPGDRCVHTGVILG
jgi:hypothetical protein